MEIGFQSIALNLKVDVVEMEKEYIEGSEGPQPGVLAQINYHLHTLYLITRSDLKTTVLPATAFALATALSGPLLTTASTTLSFPTIFSRLPLAIIWTWLNLLLFNLSNQRLPNSILEDSINKPWRALPSNRLTPSSAKNLLLFSIPVVFLSTLYLGATYEHLFLLVLTWMYNDLEGGDMHFLIRHLLNAFGFVTFGAGAATVASCSPLNRTAMQWLVFVSLVITFTIQFQDMEDQEGDLLRERRTLPIVFGDRITRRLNAGVIILFSLLGPLFWNLGWVGYVLPTSFAAVIAFRTLRLKKLKEDKTTFKLWCLWLVVIYLLPLAKGEGTLSEIWTLA